MRDIACILLGAGLVNNLILDAMLGLPPAIAVAKKIQAAADLTITMLMSLTCATVITWPLYHYLLLPRGADGLVSFVFILVITLVIKSGELLLSRYKPALHERITVFVPLVFIDSAALGTSLLNIRNAHGLFGSLFQGLGAAAGFGLVIIALAAMQERLLANAIPAPFRGLAITLITLGIMSMAFMGFNGITGG